MNDLPELYAEIGYDCMFESDEYWYVGFHKTLESAKLAVKIAVNCGGVDPETAKVINVNTGETYFYNEFKNEKTPKDPYYIVKMNVLRDSKDEMFDFDFKKEPTKEELDQVFEQVKKNYSLNK